MSDFAGRVYDLLLKVPEGKVTTYKVLAEMLGTKAYRAVGQVLKRNPDAPKVPCHRVVNSDGRLGGFMGERDGEAIEKKINLLRKEGVVVKDGQVMRFEKLLWKGEEKE
ncbi:MAG: MGMT family protein [Candidatus Pacebacteria bacterium]|jgi:methylated-DNA-[protein]-cysteine S-methyltransferase|nr:MGMT family protein [Candidatus Paceibacterota bacterium]